LRGKALRGKASRAMALIFSLVLLGLLELSIRAVTGILDLNLDVVVVHPELGRAELKRQIYVRDRYLLWRMKPGLEGEFVSPVVVPEGRRRPKFEVITNSRGFQGQEFEERKPEGVLRIVCMGNSSTFGWGVPPDSSYPRLLEKILEESSGGDVEVINAGVPGYSSLQGLVLFEREISTLEPDIVTVSYGANDGHMTSSTDYELMSEMEGPIGAVQEAFSRFHIYKLLRYAVVTFEAGERDRHGPEKAVRRVSPRESEENLKDLIGEIREAGAYAVLIELLPSQETGGWKPYEKILRKLSLAEEVPLVSTGELFRNFLEGATPLDENKRAMMDRTREIYGSGTIERHPDIYVRLDRVHPSTLGHLLIAETLVDTVSAIVGERE